MPSLALVYIHASVLITVCHLSPSGIGGRFIDTTGTTGGDITGSGITGDNRSNITGFSTFLFRTTDSSVRVTSGDLDQLRRL